MKRLIFWGGALAVVGGVYYWGKYQSELAKNLVFSLKNARLRKLNVNQIVADFDFQLTNPTDIRLDVSSIDIDVYANGKIVSNIISKKEMSIASGGTTFVPMSLNLNPKTLVGDLNNLMNLVTNLNSTQLTFRGKIKIKKFGVNIPVPFVYETTYGELVK